MLLHPLHQHRAQKAPIWMSKARLCVVFFLKLNICLNDSTRHALATFAVLSEYAGKNS